MLCSDSENALLLKIKIEESPSVGAMSVDGELLRSDCEFSSACMCSQNPEPEMAKGSKNSEAETSGYKTNWCSHTEQSKPELGITLVAMTTGRIPITERNPAKGRKGKPEGLGQVVCTLHGPTPPQDKLLRIFCPKTYEN